MSVENHYYRLLQTYIDNGLLTKTMRKEWKLQSDIGANISIYKCIFIESKARRKECVANVFHQQTGSVRKVEINTDDVFITIDDETAHLNTNRFVNAAGDVKITTTNGIQET
eukprot:17516_1